MGALHLRGSMHRNPITGQNSVREAAPALDAPTLERVLLENPTPQNFCLELAKVCRVRRSEVALLRLERSLLKFIVPFELATAGAIPVSSSAVAARTASTKKSELFNSFASVKHASIFETVRLGAEDEVDLSEQGPIQKLMSVPILAEGNKVLGVVQVCRKGFDLRNIGPDFTPEDLQQLERAARVLARAEFMKSFQ